MEGVTVTRLDPESGERQVPIELRSFGARLLTLQPRQRNRVHRHKTQEELYFVLDGELTLALEGGEELTVRSHEIAVVQPSVRRQLMNRGWAKVSVLAVGAAGEHASGDGEAFTDWSDNEPKRPPDVPMPDDLPD